MPTADQEEKLAAARKQLDEANQEAKPEGHGPVIEHLPPGSSVHVPPAGSPERPIEVANGERYDQTTRALLHQLILDLESRGLLPRESMERLRESITGL